MSITKPNVIIILTDDQGYGDLSAHGNPVIKTPEMDRLRGESVRFTDFHAAPMCTPARGQLMTGLDAMRHGATAVCQGRSMVHRDIKMMPQYFEEAGYATGLFGKWHLGDSYPYRPRFRGFQEVVSFRAWGITSLADHWDNDYFDPYLMHNGIDKQYSGYCTDIFFDEAMDWMAGCQDEGKPFFVYLPTNTPHVPEIVDDKYSTPYVGEYQDKPVPSDFFGMIVNIDENLGRLEAFLKERGMRDNTILIFMSDNGTQNGKAEKLHNSGMRDRKCSVFEGGHRVPCFIRWPNGEFQHGIDIPDLTQMQDLLPTFVDLCSLATPDTELDGVSLAGVLTGEQSKLDDRVCVSQYQVSGAKWEAAVVMWDKWRLIAGNELYNISTDPHQDTNVIDQFPDVARKMNDHYDAWYNAVRPVFDQQRPIIIGSNESNPMMIYASDWQGDYCDNRGGLINATGKGYWDLIVDTAGDYTFELRRWPEESGKALIEAYDDESDRGIRPISKAQLIIGDFEQTVDTGRADALVSFSLPLKQGETTLTANFLDAGDNVLCGAMYVKVMRG